MAKKEKPTTKFMHFCMPICETQQLLLLCLQCPCLYGCGHLIRMGMSEYVCHLSLRANEPALGEFTTG